MVKKSLWQKYVGALKRDLHLDKVGEDSERNRNKIRHDTYSYYCPYCKGMREGIKKFSWGWFFFWTIITVGFGFWLYLIYYAGFKSKTDCHTCKAKIAKSNGHALFTKSSKK